MDRYWKAVGDNALSDGYGIDDNDLYGFAANDAVLQPTLSAAILLWKKVSRSYILAATKPNKTPLQADNLITSQDY